MTIWPPSGWFNRGITVDVPVVMLPARYPDAALDYAVDISNAIDPLTDFPVSASVWVAPSGAGEMTIARFTVSGGELVIVPAGGQPGRTYTLKFEVTMIDGRVFPFIAGQRVTALLAADVPQTAPSPEFGSAVSWTFSPSLDFSNPLNTAWLPVLTGF